MLAPGSAPPRVVATVGMHGSASTWVLNVVLELMIAAIGEIKVVSLYADQREQLPNPAGRCLVIKSHHGSANLGTWLAEADARCFLSVRDPREACISMCNASNRHWHTSSYGSAMTATVCCVRWRRDTPRCATKTASLKRKT